jgi:hypothetical protein
MKMNLLLPALLAVGAAAHAAPITYEAVLDGANQSPPNASPGTGFATVIFDGVANTMRVEVTFSGLLGPTTASHIHAPTAVPGAGNVGVATAVPTFTGFPLGVTSGTHDHTFDMTLASSYNPAYITANGGTPASAETALGAALAAGEAYLNIHTQVFPGGEIRGFLLPTPAPEAVSTFGLLGLAFGGLCGASRLRGARVAQ